MTTSTVISTARAVPGGKRRRRGPEWLTPYLFLAPYFLIFSVFLLVPTLVGIYTSFTRWGILGSPEFIGLANYQRILTEPRFLQSLLNTGYFVLLAAPPLVILGLGLALLLNEPLRGRSITRTIVFLPHAVTVTAVGLVWVWIYDRNWGLLNYYLSALGLPKLAWLTDVNSAMPALALTTLWWLVNNNTIIYLAALQDIPQELYDAAKIDGAGVWARFRWVTLPSLLTVNAFVIPLTVIGCWRVFGQAYVMTQGGPQGRTFVISQYIYLTAFQNFQMGPAAAAAVVLMLLTLLFTIVQLRALRVH